MRLKLAAALMCAAAIAAGLSTPSFFEIRPVLDAPSADSQQMVYTSKDGQRLVLNVQKTALLDLTAVESAHVIKDVSGSPFGIEIRLTAKGRERFAETTAQNIHKQIAVIVDGKVYAAPVIQARISTEAISISDHFATEQQAA